MLKPKQSKRYSSQNNSFLNNKASPNQLRSNSTNQLYLNDVHNKVLPKIKIILSKKLKIVIKYILYKKIKIMK